MFRTAVLTLLAACSTVPERSAATLVGTGGSGPAPTEFADPVEELGSVTWPRGLDGAMARSKASGKPVLVLFDEVPGCSTVKGFGTGALTHPLLAEAIETAFEPVVVYNNTADDAALCARFDEPRWNNPVVRYLDGDGRDVAPRFAGPYTEAAFAESLAGALGSRAPEWLTLIRDELVAADRAETATYSMACFWSGEAHLGSVDGVVGTRTGWQGGREVVEVRFDPDRTTRRDLDRHASSGGARPMEQGSLSPTPGDDRYRLRHTEWASVPMTPTQATRANALLSEGKDPSALFSPRQQARKGGALGDLGSSDLRAAFR
ncbi:MAG: thioredoxin family (seleno)protein [Myxococcota bacterium]